MKAGVTKYLISYCATTIYELEDLRLLKIYYNLTDFGVKKIVDFAMPNAISPITVIKMLDYSSGYDLQETRHRGATRKELLPSLRL